MSERSPISDPTERYRAGVLKYVQMGESGEHASRYSARATGTADNASRRAYCGRIRAHAFSTPAPPSPPKSLGDALSFSLPTPQTPRPSS